MKRNNGILLSFLHGSMELSWLYAWAFFTTLAAGSNPFPFSGAIGIFVFSALLTRSTFARGLRIVSILCLQFLGFVVGAFTVIYLSYYGQLSFLGMEWLARFFADPRSDLEWLVVALNVFWILLFWTGGMALARRSSGYFAICSRFDVGLAAFFVLFLAKLVLTAQGEGIINESVSGALVFPFFLCSLLSIGTARGQGHIAKEFLPGYQGIGVMASFAAAVTLFAGGVILFLLPAMSKAARMGDQLLKDVAGPMGSILTRIAVFLFLPRNSRPPAAGESGKPLHGDWLSSGDGSWWGDLLGKILGWGVGGVAGVTVLILLCLTGIYLIKWLLSRTPVDGKGTGESVSFAALCIRLWRYLVSAWKRISDRLKPFEGAVGLYRALLRWASLSGLHRKESETPGEFGMRLTRQFPELRKEILLIVDAFNREVYGETALRREELSLLRLALHGLRSPFHWYLRCKTRFYSGYRKPGRFARFPAVKD